MEKIMIYWDVGGVLMELNYRGLYERGAALTGTSYDEFKRKYNDSKLELGVLRGAILDKEYQ